METTKKIHRPPNRDLEESSHLTASTTTPPSNFYLFFLLIISTLWTRRLPHLAQSSACATLLAFPFAHFSTILAGLTWISRRTKGRSETVEIVMRRSWATLLGRKDGNEADAGREWDDDRGRSLLRWTAVSCVVSLSLHLWSSRWMIDREVEALDVFVLPLVFLLEPSISAYFRDTHDMDDRGSGALPAAVVAFLTGLALIGTPATFRGLSISLLRLPIEACSLVLLKLILISKNDVLDVLHATTLAASLLSLIPIPLICLLPHDSLFPTWNLLPLLKLFASVALSAAAQSVLILGLHHFSSLSTVLFVIYPRNTILIIDSALSKGRQELSSKTLQLFLSQSVGSFAFGRHLLGETTSLDDEFLELSSLDGIPEEFDETSQPPAFGSISLYLCFLPLLLFVWQSPSSHSSLLPVTSACSYLSSQLRLSVCPSILPLRPAPTVDLVVSYYDENFHMVRTHLTWMRRANFVARKRSRMVIYNKGPRTEEEIRKGLGLRSTDEVVPLDNFGREGATYLLHILLHYNETTPTTSPIDPTLSKLRNQLRRNTLADHTFFLQPHLATGIIAVPRLWELQDDVGFVHLGILLKSVCGEDDAGTGSYPMVGRIFNMFREQICPPTGQTIGWSAQFLVSKRRILANGYEKYAELDRLLEAPSDHWLHSLWGPNGSKDAGNPAFGHSVERAWPIIFDCWDPKVAEECPGRSPGPVGRCQCIDL